MTPCTAQRKTHQQVCRTLEQKVREAQNPPTPVKRTFALPASTWTTALRRACAHARLYRTRSAPSLGLYDGSTQLAFEKDRSLIVNSQFNNNGLGIGSRDIKYPSTPGPGSISHVGAMYVNVLAVNKQPIAKYLAAPAWRFGEKRDGARKSAFNTLGPGSYTIEPAQENLGQAKRRTMRMPSSWCSIP
eukprot:GEMP01051603.1.p1 GENE.GEMP01051603.1~~GEMP01051603.1.p1  ORF type:complete len:188 (+),score=32.01 GEMP01051603.1:127-690(+)